MQSWIRSDEMTKLDYSALGTQHHNTTGENDQLEPVAKYAAIPVAFILAALKIAALFLGG
jgi:hypothetical protein